MVPARARIAGLLLAGALALLSSPQADARKPRPAARGQVTVVTQGFRMTDAGSEYFLVLSAAPDGQTLQTEAGGVTLRVPRARAAKPLRALDTRYFATPIQTIETARKGKDLVLHFKLKEAVAPTLDVRQEQGATVLVLLFPPGKADETPPPRPQHAPSAAPVSDGGEPAEGGASVSAEAQTEARAARLRDRAAAGDDGAARMLCLDECETVYRTKAPVDEDGFMTCVTQCDKQHPRKAAPPR